MAMYKNKTFLAIIPARKGSKRLPGKNILDLHGKPLIAWSIEAGLKSRYIDEVVVTSDSDEILEISERFGAKTLKRPYALAHDKATTLDALLHAVQYIKKHFDYIVLLQPTSPLRGDKHIDEAVELLMNKKADAVVSVTEMDHSPLWSNTLPENGNMENFLRRELLQKRSQDLQKYYRINGAIYIINTNILLQEKTLFPEKNIYSYIMDRSVSIDIDEKIDLEIASFFISKR